MKFSSPVSTPCVTCGAPVTWMAQHRTCWRKEGAHGKLNHAPRFSKRRRTVEAIPAASAEEVERIENECRAYALEATA